MLCWEESGQRVQQEGVLPSRLWSVHPSHRLWNPQVLCWGCSSCAWMCPAVTVNIVIYVEVFVDFLPISKYKCNCFYILAFAVLHKLVSWSRIIFYVCGYAVITSRRSYITKAAQSWFFLYCTYVLSFLCPVIMFTALYPIIFLSRDSFSSNYACFCTSKAICWCFMRHLAKFYHDLFCM